MGDITEMSHGRIFQGDSLDICSDPSAVQPESVDLIIIDFPYGIGKTSLKNERKSWKKSSELWDTFSSIEAQYEFYLKHLRLYKTLLKKTGSIFAFGSYHNLYLVGEIIQRQLGLHLINSITWHKPNAMFSQTRRSLVEGTEHIIWAGKTKDFFFNYVESKRIGGDTQLRNVWTSGVIGKKEKRTAGSGHPHQKPAWLIERLIRIACPEGGLVLDPMAGSGTTAVVCYGLSCQCLLVEKSEKYFDMATKRWENYFGNSEDHFDFL